MPGAAARTGRPGRRRAAGQARPPLPGPGGPPACPGPRPRPHPRLPGGEAARGPRAARASRRSREAAPRATGSRPPGGGAAHGPPAPGRLTPAQQGWQAGVPGPHPGRAPRPRPHQTLPCHRERPGPPGGAAKRRRAPPAAAHGPPAPGRLAPAQQGWQAGVPAPCPGRGPRPRPHLSPPAAQTSRRSREAAPRATGGRPPGGGAARGGGAPTARPLVCPPSSRPHFSPGRPYPARGRAG